MSNAKFAIIAFVTAIALIAASALLDNNYYYSLAFRVLQFVILATAWNILGGYTGYVNFGSAGFFAIGAYTTVFLHIMFDAPLPLTILVGTIVGSAVAGLAGLGLGYLTLRLKGVYFSIATLALAVMLATFVINWDYVGGARGAYVIPPAEGPFGFRTYHQFLCAIMGMLATFSIVVARIIEKSTLGRGLAAIRDDELAAECAGVPTLKLKLISTAVSGALMGMAGTTFPMYITYVEPVSTFDLAYAVNAIAMPVIGGMTTWLGPLIGAVLVGTLQQVAQVTIASEWNLLIVGALLVFFVTVAPDGIMGWVQALRKKRS